MQPTHCTSDMPWATSRLGADRVLGAYAWQRLRAAGVRHLPLGSDFPVESPNPMLGLYAAVTRLSPKGTSPHGAEGWFPGERLTRLQALRGFTVDAAYAAFQENETGTITPGQVGRPRRLRPRSDHVPSPGPAHGARPLHNRRRQGRLFCGLTGQAPTLRPARPRLDAERRLVTPDLLLVVDRLERMPKVGGVLPEGGAEWGDHSDM